MAQRTKVTDPESTITSLQSHLASLSACAEARTWTGTKTARETWETCDRADWMLWWAARTNVNTASDIVRCAAKIARTVAHLNTDTRFMAAIEAAEAWADDPDDETASRAAWASWAVARAADAAARASWAVARAADAADAASRAAAKSNQDYCALIRASLKQPWNET